MHKKFIYLVVVYSIFIFSPLSWAVEPLPKDLLHFSSPEALALKDKLNQNSLKLLSHFTTQYNLAYCGVASAVMVLNSLDIIAPVDIPHTPYSYFTQDNFFNDPVKKIILPETVDKQGMTLDQLSATINTYDVKTQVIYADKIDMEKMRNQLKNALDQQQFIIANFLRSALQQQGGGHHSPIAAYDPGTDRFLLLDVARYKYPAYWVKTAALWKAVNTEDMDNKTYRGFVIIDNPGNKPATSATKTQ